MGNHLHCPDHVHGVSGNGHGKGESGGATDRLAVCDQWCRKLGVDSVLALRHVSGHDGLDDCSCRITLRHRLAHWFAQECDDQGRKVDGARSRQHLHPLDLSCNDCQCLRDASRPRLGWWSTFIRDVDSHANCHCRLLGRLVHRPARRPGVPFGTHLGIHWYCRQAGRTVGP